MLKKRAAGRQLKMQQQMRGVLTPLERAGRSRSQRPNGSVAAGTRRSRTWRFGTLARVGVVCFAVLLLGSGVAFAGGAFKGAPGTQKDALVAYGEVIFVGSANYWESSFDPENDLPINLLVDGTPATDTAREHLYLLNVELGAVMFLRVGIDAVSTSPGGVIVHSVDQLAVTLGELTLSDFGTMQLESSSGASPPFPYTSVSTACDTLNPCDWVWGFADTPNSIDPSGTLLEFDDSVPSSGAPQHGLRFYYGGDVGTLPSNNGAVEITSVTSPAYVMVDLDVPDLPTAWQTANGTNVRVVASVSGGIYYYEISVPAMSLSGAAVLILGVLGLGFLVLGWPTRRTG